MNMELDDLPPRYRAQAEQQLAARKRRAADPLAEAVKQAKAVGRDFDSRGEYEFYTGTVLPKIARGEIVACEQHPAFPLFPAGECSTNDTGKMTVANDSHWRFTDKVVSNLVELVKYLMAEYGIDAAHVIRHYDVNGKPCPGIIGWNEDTGSAAKWAAFKARLGAATPGGQTGGSTNTGTATGNTALTYKVGDIVQFAGGKHYANSQATSGTTVKPGQAKVTAVAPAGKHPYHIVHTDSASTVYGWVDAAAITGKASATPAAKTYTVKAGDSLWRIAAQQLGNGARYKEIKTMNGLKNNTIHAGQVLKLPN